MWKVLLIKINYERPVNKILWKNKSSSTFKPTLQNNLMFLRMDGFFNRPGPKAGLINGIDVCVCVCVCLSHPVLLILICTTFVPKFQKFRILETPTILTDADSSRGSPLSGILDIFFSAAGFLHNKT